MVFTLELTHAAATAIVVIDALHKDVIQQIRNNKTVPIVFICEKNIPLTFYPMLMYSITMPL